MNVYSKTNTLLIKSELWKSLLCSLLLLGITALNSCSSNKQIPITKLTSTQISTEISPTPTVDAIKSPVGITKTPTIQQTPASQYFRCSDRIDQISGEIVYAFEWSDDSQAILYTIDSEQKNWYMYEIANRSIVPLEHGVEGLVYPEYVRDRFDLAQIDKRDLSVSPTGGKTIFVKYINNEPVSTPQSNGESGGGNVVKNEVYLLTPDSPEIHVGDIFGAIDGFEWFPDENSVFIYMDVMAPVIPGEAYFWNIDLINQSIEPILERNNINDEAIYLDLSPNGKKILYYLRLQHTVRIYNINDASDQEISLDWHRWVKWFNDDELIVVRPVPEANKYSVYGYKISSQQIMRLSDKLISPHPFVSGSLQYSNDFHYIAFINEDDRTLFLLTLCTDN